MKKIEIDRTLRHILCDDLQYITNDELTAATLLSDLQIDSLDLVDVIARIRILCPGIHVSVCDIRDCRTYSDLIKAVSDARYAIRD